MRLHKHREDIAALRLMDDNYVQEIARRYHRLILMAEYAIPIEQEYFGDLSYRTERVLKDAEK